MALGIAIETTSAEYGVAVHEGRDVLGHKTLLRTDSAFTGIAGLAESVMSACGRRFQDIEHIAVNAGPGNLTSVRAGVAYANGLAFALDVPVAQVDALTLLAAEVRTEVDDHVLCLRNSDEGTVYAAVFGPGRTEFARGRVADVVKPLTHGIDAVLVAGARRGEVAAAVAGVRVTDTGVANSSVLTLHRLVTSAGSPEVALLATPITEQSSLFGG